MEYKFCKRITNPTKTRTWKYSYGDWFGSSYSSLIIAGSFHRYIFHDDPHIRDARCDLGGCGRRSLNPDDRCNFRDGGTKNLPPLFQESSLFSDSGFSPDRQQNH